MKRKKNRRRIPRKQLKKVRRRIPRKQLKKVRRRIPRKQIKKIRKKIRRRVRLVTIVRLQKVQKKFNEERQKLLSQLEEKGGENWRRWARAKGQTYANYKRAVYKRLRVLSVVADLAAREVQDRARLMKKGRHKGQYQVLDKVTNKPKYLTPPNLARSLAMIRYWARIKWLRALLEGGKKKYSLSDIRDLYSQLMDDKGYRGGH